ncbi:hypothetical protein BAE44_0002085 [Dichanthelium oligosanthes]|uniref:DUF7915 domain-containing protein n=1 Tax=Dichanthelium oligosanthes TaxID=888268 RepID=A0A1E5WHM2_9POAL|nr:hypothetical protein BAE44_0002085 [Dichanthelium oligosanthes]
MSGPIFESDPCLATTYVVECYHLLPYKEVLLNILNREWLLDSSLSAPKEQEANSKSKMEKITSNISIPKKNKQVVKAVGDSGTSKNKNNSKRKSKTFRATLPPYPEHGDGESPTKETDSRAAPDVKSVKPTKSTNGGSVDLQANIDPVIKNHDLESEKEKVTEKYGGITGNMNVQKYATLQLLQKMRDDTLHEHCILGD